MYLGIPSIIYRHLAIQQIVGMILVLLLSLMQLQGS